MFLYRRYKTCSYCRIDNSTNRTHTHKLGLRRYDADFISFTKTSQIFCGFFRSKFEGHDILCYVCVSVSSTWNRWLYKVARWIWLTNEPMAPRFNLFVLLFYIFILIKPTTTTTLPIYGKLYTYLNSIFFPPVIIKNTHGHTQQRPFGASTHLWHLSETTHNIHGFDITHNSDITQTTLTTQTQHWHHVFHSDVSHEKSHTNFQMKPQNWLHKIWTFHPPTQYYPIYYTYQFIIKHF